MKKRSMNGTSAAVSDYAYRQAKVEGMGKSQLGCSRSSASEGLHFGSSNESKICFVELRKVRGGRKISLRSILRNRSAFQTEPPSENACRFNRSMQHYLSRSLFQRCIHEGEAMETIAAWGFGLFGN